MTDLSFVVFHIYLVVIQYIFFCLFSGSTSQTVAWQPDLSFVVIVILLEADAYQWQQSPCLLTMALIQFMTIWFMIMTLDIQLLEVLSLAQALLLSSMNKIFCSKTDINSFLYDMDRQLDTYRHFHLPKT